jgi:hypothetical protein
MRRSVVAVSLIVALVGMSAQLVGSVPVGWLAVDTAAQAATPAADPDNLVVTCDLTPADATPETVTVETAAGEVVYSCGVVSNESTAGAWFAPLLVVDEVPLPSPAFLTLSRATVASGEVWPAIPDDPTVALILVETGSLTVRTGGVVEVSRTGGGRRRRSRRGRRSSWGRATLRSSARALGARCATTASSRRWRCSP